MARAGAALLALLLAVGAAGCGEEDGVADGATVTVYAEAALCEGATNQTGRVNGTEGSVKLRVVCLPDPRGPELGQGVGGGREIDLATVGANARRATEDSTSVAYLETDDPEVNRFTHPIIEAAGIGWVTSDSRGAAMQQVLLAIAAAGSGSVRDEVRESLESG